MYKLIKLQKVLTKNNADSLDVYLCRSLFSSALIQTKSLQDALQQLRGVINDIHLFSDPDECVDFLTDVQKEQIFLIISGTESQHIVPHIHQMTQLDAIFLVNDKKLRDEQWTKAWPKVQDAYRDIEFISQAVPMGAKRCNQESIAVSFSRSNGEDTSITDLDQLESSFMYTQLFKNALLDMPHDEQAVQDLMQVWKKKHADDHSTIALNR